MLTEKRRPTRQEVKEDRAETINIGGRLEIGHWAFGLLRGDVAGRAKDGERTGEVARSIKPFGEAKVAHQRLTVAVEQNVTRFQIAMEDALPMRILHRARHLRQQTHDFARVIAQRRPNFLQAAARCVLHAEEGDAVLALPHFVDGQNIRVIEARRGFRFPPETGQRLVRVGVITQRRA